MNLKHLINWKLYFVLLAASIFSILAILPYVTTLQAEALKSLTIPLPLALFLSVLQGAVLIAILLLIGLPLSKSLGLQIPILESFLAKQQIKVDVSRIVKKSLLLGVATGVVIILLDRFFVLLGTDVMSEVAIPAWQGLLASFYGGISEEILLRLFFMTFVVWVMSKVIRPTGKAIENSLLMWSAILLAALLFGIGHLPVTATLTTLTPLVIFRALLLNGIGGVVFGWLYWKNGLESAMIAHFSADIVLHGLFPLILLFW